MAEFPITGMFREPILLLEVLIAILCIEFGCNFLIKYIKGERERSNYMILAWAFFFFAISGMFIFFIISDLFVSGSTPEIREMFVTIGYITMSLGALIFVFNAEREVETKHYFFLLLLGCFVFMVIDFFLLIIDPVFLAYISWIPFVLLLLIYLRKFMGKIKEYRFNIYGIFPGFLLFGVGYSATIDAMQDIFGFGARLLGDILIICGIILISTLFIGLPSMRELDWSQKIQKILLMHNSGICICEHDFVDRGVSGGDRQISTEFMAGSLIGISNMISELIRSKSRLEIVDHQDKKVIFAYGEYLIAALIADDDLEIYRIKLKKLIESLEMLYKDVLRDWKGELFHFKPVRRILHTIFS